MADRLCGLAMAEDGEASAIKGTMGSPASAASDGDDVEPSSLAWALLTDG